MDKAHYEEMVKAIDGLTAHYLLQACLYTEDETSFIAHQDRSYMVNLHKALYLKCIPLEIIYRCGVFGLPIGTEPVKPENLQAYPRLEQIKKGNAVVFSPYAKSVTSLPEDVWAAIVSDYKAKGYQCFTNVAGEEKPLAGTTGISPTLSQVQSLMEWAGTFVGIRSGLCDVLKYAACDKTALFPDYHYCDTKWKAILGIDRMEEMGFHRTFCYGLLVSFFIAKISYRYFLPFSAWLIKSRVWKILYLTSVFSSQTRRTKRTLYPLSNITSSIK